MSKLIALIKVSLKSGSNFSTNSDKSNAKRLFSIIAIAILMITSFSLPMASRVGELYDGLSKIGQEGIILWLLILSTTVIVFVFGIMYVMGTFYFSKDIEYLLPLPLKPWEITMSKFITVLIYEYMTEAIMLVGPIIAFGVKASANAVYWIASIIIFIMLPIFPLVAAAILNMILMSFTNVGKHKEKLRTIGGLLGIFLGIGISMLMSNMSRSINNDQEKFASMMSQGNNSMLISVDSIFPTSKFSSLALVNSDNIKCLYYMLAVLVITIISIMIFMLLANVLYFKGALGGSEVVARRENMRKEDFIKATKEKSIIISYTIKELKILFRTPAYLINCVIMSFLWPIFLIIPMVANAGQLNELAQYGAKISELNIDGMILGIAVNVMFFIAASNIVSATSISREGGNAFFMKYIPISYKKQLLSKVLSGVVLSMITLVFLIIGLIYIKMNVIFILTFIILSIIASIASNFICILIDLSKPKLNWDNEQVAVKQNFRSMISFFLCFIIAGLNIAVFVSLSPTFLISALIIFVEMTVILLIFKYIVESKSDKYFEEIE